jgi:uncharacterized protein YfdQ (DUF2303 family)
MNQSKPADDSGNMLALAIESANTVARSLVRPLALPPGWTINDLERFAAGRARARNSFTTHSAADFDAYVRANREGEAVVLVDVPTMNERQLAEFKLSATAVLNAGTKESPGHCDNQAALLLRHTPQWRALCCHTWTAMDQVKLAEFMEDWFENLTFMHPDGTDLGIEAAVAIRKFTTEAKQVVERVSAARSDFESIRASGPSVPAAIIYKAPIFIGRPDVELKMRLRIRLNPPTAPTFDLIPIAAELCMLKAMDDFAESLRAEHPLVHIGCLKVLE